MSVVDNAVSVDGRRAEEPPSLDQAVGTLHRCRHGSGDGGAPCRIGLLRPGSTVSIFRRSTALFRRTAGNVRSTSAE